MVHIMECRIFVVCIIGFVYVNGEERVKVKVTQGWLEGEKLETVTGDTTYYSYKGIPYAQPPVGKLRFKAPQLPVPWEGLRKATEHGSKCPQREIFTNKLILGSEDCLFLNVYTPRLETAEPMAVIFFIHGGAFKCGSGNVDSYGPDFLVAHDVVVVTINYRLEVLGFLCMDTEEVPGNAGLKDQVAALRWVQENICNFGGDPKRVTIMGQSAGGASVSLHLISPMSKGLFKRAIAMSGFAFNEWALPFKAEVRPFALGKQLGLNTANCNELLEHLQSLPVEKLVDTCPSIVSSEEMSKDILIKKFYFTPVIERCGDNNFLTQNISQALSKGNVHEADLLFGYANEQSILIIDDIVKTYLKAYDRYPEMIIPKKILHAIPPENIMSVSKRIHNHYFGHNPINLEVIKEFVGYMNDYLFIYDIHRYVDMLPKIGNSRQYFYMLSALSGRNYYGKGAERYGIRGTGHLDDLLYLFDAKALNMTISKNSKEHELVQLVTTAFTNFAKYGTPTPDSSSCMSWPEYEPATKHYVDIGNSLEVKSNPDADSIEFWSNLYAEYEHLYDRYK